MSAFCRHCKHYKKHEDSYPCGVCDGNSMYDGDKKNNYVLDERFSGVCLTCEHREGEQLHAPCDGCIHQEEPRP